MEDAHRQEAQVVLFVACLLVAACAAPRHADPWPSGKAAETVGWLDDRPVTYGEVARYLRTRDPEAFSKGLEGLILERATRAEARRLGVSAPSALLSRATRARMEEWQRRVRDASRQETGREIDPALWLQRVAGISVAAYRKQIRRHAEVEILQDLLSRYEMLTSRRVRVSVLVVDKQAAGERIKGQIEKGGDDFARLARKHSSHATAREGGRLDFPLLEADINDAEVRRALFEARSGQLRGPFETRGGKERYYQLFRVEALLKARQGSYRELKRAILADLVKRPVAVGEYERWRRRVLLRHGFAAAPAPGDAG